MRRSVFVAAVAFACLFPYRTPGQAPDPLVELDDPRPDAQTDTQSCPSPSTNESKRERSLLRVSPMAVT